MKKAGSNLGLAELWPMKRVAHPDTHPKRRVSGIFSGLIKVLGKIGQCPAAQRAPPGIERLAYASMTSNAVLTCVPASLKVSSGRSSQ